MNESDPGKVAAIDCGTNSTRLLIVDASGKRLVEELRITRLGEGVHANRRLGDAAMGRTLSALEEYRTLLDAHRVEVFRAVATSAVRDSSNADEFMQAATNVLRQKLGVISGNEEALLTYTGASPQTSGTNVVIDIGGGSTELVFGENGKILHAHSIDIGSVRMMELFLHNDPPHASEIDAVADYVRQQMRNVIAPTQGMTFTAVAGTAAAIACMDLGLRSWRFDEVDGHCMTRERVSELCDDLAAMTSAERSRTTGMPIGRAEVIVGGAIVLVEAMRALDADRTFVSARDLLDGIALRLLSDRSIR